MKYACTGRYTNQCALQYIKNLYITTKLQTYIKMYLLYFIWYIITLKEDTCIKGYYFQLNSKDYKRF